MRIPLCHVLCKTERSDFHNGTAAYSSRSLFLGGSPAATSYYLIAITVPHSGIGAFIKINTRLCGDRRNVKMASLSQTVPLVATCPVSFNLLFKPLWHFFGPCCASEGRGIDIVLQSEADDGRKNESIRRNVKLSRPLRHQIGVNHRNDQERHEGACGQTSDHAPGHGSPGLSACT